MRRIAGMDESRDQRNSLKIDGLRPVFTEWLFNTENLEFLSTEDQQAADARAYVQRGQDFFPKHFRDILASGRSLVDDSGHFIAPEEWLQEFDCIGLTDTTYQFALKAAPLDSQPLPYEPLATRQWDAGQSSSKQTLEREFTRWAKTVNVYLLPRHVRAVRGERWRRRHESRSGPSQQP
jgi:hypothetical protein